MKFKFISFNIEKYKKEIHCHIVYKKDNKKYKKSLVL